MVFEIPLERTGPHTARHVVSVIIPTRNEPLIRSLVEDIHKTLSFVKHEIIVVDKSREPPKIPLAIVVPQETTGLGNAILEGLRHATGNWILIMDGDFSHRPADVGKMVKSLGSADFILGSRYAKGGKNLDVPLRRIASRFFNLLARLFLHLKFMDPMSGLILARAQVFQKVDPNPIGFKVNLELVYRATSMGFRGSELPIVFQARSAGRSKAGLHEGVRTLAYMLALRVR